MKNNINIILAVDQNWGLGINNDLLYSFKNDLIRFKDYTSGKTVVMGRKTWESLPKKLPNRKNIVISNSPIENSDLQTNDINQILGLEEEIWVIGGASIYELFLPFTNKIELTFINGIKNNDINALYMKEIIDRDFELINTITIKDIDRITNQEYDITYFTYVRKINVTLLNDLT